MAAGKKKSGKATAPRARRQALAPGKSEIAGLKEQLAEARAQRAATAEILKIISRSPADTGPVFDGITKSAAKLCGAPISAVILFDGKMLQLASIKVAPRAFKPFSKLWPMPIERSGVQGVVVRERKLVNVSDVESDKRIAKWALPLYRKLKIRSGLWVPMIRKGAVIGMIVTFHHDAAAFGPESEGLLKTFADQAVVAIENARLFKQTRQALERQTATAQILGAMSGSMQDAKPVFNAIVKSCAELFPGSGVTLRLLRDGVLHIEAYIGLDSGPVPVDPTSGVGACVLRARTIHLPDLEAAVAEFPRIRQLGLKYGFHSGIYAPLLREGVAIGTISVLRREAGGFSDEDVALFNTFADQAVIAIENVRLFNETKEALERQTATSEILRVISSSPTDLKPVFDAILENALRLCEAHLGILNLREAGSFRTVAQCGANPAGAKWLFERGAFKPEDTLQRMIAERQPVQIPDLKAAPAYRARKPITVGMVETLKARTFLVVPLLMKGEVIGNIAVYRPEVRLFSEKQIALVSTFADQAVIAIENVRLFNETKEALERQTATAEILKVISSSPTDVQPVFDAIVRSTLRLMDGFSAVVTRVVGDSIHLAALSSTSAEGDAAIKALYPVPLSSNAALARAINTGRPSCRLDTETDPDISAREREMARLRGYRSNLIVPMMREGRAIGSIGVTRRQPGEFPEHQVELLKTFADQAVIAIQNVRLFNETKEALERQTATADILKVIASSPSDVQPVFDAIVETAKRLIGAFSATVTRVGDGKLHLVAHTATTPEGAEALNRYFPIPIEGTPMGRAIQLRRPEFIDDFEADSDDARAGRDLARSRGFRSVVFVPLMRGDIAIGSLNVTRREAGRFSDHHVSLLKTFADQAVIAIESVRLFNETREALERQTATAEILRVIASSPSDVQPVFDAIAGSALRLIGGTSASVARVVDGMLHLAALTSTSKVADNELRKRFPAPLTDRTIIYNAAIAAGAPVVRADTETHPEVSPSGRELARLRGYRSQVAVPMTRDGSAIGAIVVARRDPGEFSGHEIGLLETFADQAVIAIENVRLFNETKEALERQTATSGILEVMSGSPTDVQPVFDAIVKSGARLFSGAGVAIALPVDGQVRIASIADENPERCERWKASYPFPLTRDYMHATAILDHRAIDVPDALDPPAEWGAGIKNFVRTGYRALTIMPLMRGDTVFGTVSVVRVAPGPLTDKQIAILKTFADQAVIAIENVRLFNETKEALEQQTASSEILGVISSSPTDLSPVFDAILGGATRLCEAHLGVLNLYDGENFRTVAQRGGNPAFAKWVIERGAFKPPNTMARMIVDRQPVQLEDVRALPAFREGNVHAVNFGTLGGARSYLTVPLIKEDKVIGGISIYRPEVLAFTEKQIELVKTFANQAVIAIENVRLFNETKEALERQTATAEILKVIASSPSDVQPVFDAIAKASVRLIGGFSAAVLRFDGDVVHLAALTSTNSSGDEHLRSMFPRPVKDSETAIRGGGISVCVDSEIDTVISEEIRGMARARGWRSRVIVPMVRDNVSIGYISVTRSNPGSFSDHQVVLLKTFADQAVIAIENVRLFKELQSRTEALTRSVGQLTALGEVGQAISSTLELETVLQTIVSRAVQLAGLDGGSIYEYDERAEEFRLQASENIDEVLLQAVRETPVRKGEGAIGRTALTLESAQVPDILDDSYHSGRKDLLVRSGYRAILAVPLLREDHLLGALQVFRRMPGAFAPEIVELLKTFATQSAMAIQNARLFREIAEKGKQLEVASRHKSDFLASMSHELRTPLNAILGFNEMILGQIYGEVPKDMQEPLNDIQKSGKHLLRLINNVLDLAKIEAGRMELSLQDYSVHDTVESVRSTLRPLAAEKGLEFLASVPNDIPLAYGDGGRITQCLMNLAGNSLKFTKAGKVEISVALRDDTLVYKVADTGIGIPPDKIGSLFTEFKQTDATIANEYGGTGLGLSISRQFIEMHGGRIWVESELGKGSAFIFEVPLRVKTP